MTRSAKCCIRDLPPCVSFPKSLAEHLAEFTFRRIHEPDLPPQQLMMPTELIRLRVSGTSRTSPAAVASAYVQETSL